MHSININYNDCCTEEETQAQRGKVTDPRRHNKLAVAAWFKLVTSKQLCFYYSLLHHDNLFQFKIFFYSYLFIHSFNQHLQVTMAYALSELWVTDVSKIHMCVCSWNLDSIKKSKTNWWLFTKILIKSGGKIIDEF